MHLPPRRVGVDKELLTLMTGQAHYLKLLIRIGLRGALQVSSVPDIFPDELSKKDQSENWIEKHTITKLQQLGRRPSDLCASCKKPVESACYFDSNSEIMPISEIVWHLQCLACQRCNEIGAYNCEPETERNGINNCIFCSQPRSKNIKFVSLRNQYLYLLWVALSRFVAICKFEWTQVLEAEK